MNIAHGYIILEEGESLPSRVVNLRDLEIAKSLVRLSVGFGVIPAECKIRLIRTFREITCNGLKECKDAIDLAILLHQEALDAR
jgi:ribosomal protein L7/L12